MKIAIAKKTGFCFGVRRAIDIAEKVLRQEDKAFSLGSIIHNRQVVMALGERGLIPAKDHRTIRRGTVVAPSHGLSPKVAGALKKRGLKIVDTTCPFVLNAQHIAEKLGKEGYLVVVVGDKAHPEIRALIDFIPGGRVRVVKDSKEAEGLAIGAQEKVSVLSQTTQSYAIFAGVLEVLIKKSLKELRVFNTICHDAGERQHAASELAKTVDIMIVVGGRESANTRRLFEVTSGEQPNSYHIETEEELRPEWFLGAPRVGITSGASTPDWIINKVIKRSVGLTSQGGTVQTAGQSIRSRRLTASRALRPKKRRK